MIPVTPLLAVDIVIYRGTGYVFIKRKNEPFKGQYALPGGFVDVGETLEQAAVREAKEETNLDVEIIGMVGIYDDPSRDPRGHVVTVCFVARGWGNLEGKDDATEAIVIDSLEIPKLAFDHNKMINRVREHYK